MRKKKILSILAIALALPALGFSAPSVQVNLDGNDVNFNGSTSKKSVESFKGIKYATANRWVSPQKYSYTGQKSADATKFGPICPQSSQSSQPQSEDCLLMNVYRPSSTEKGDNLPVFLYIHGGAFIQGSSSTPAFDGNNIVSENAAQGNKFILVTINYRLGLFGFKQTPGQKTGNFGILDQLMAMNWVSDNINNFGGDAKNITLFGESAGAMSVGIHLSNQNISGVLFQKAIMESNPYGIPYKSESEATKVSEFVNAMIDGSKEVKVDKKKQSFKCNDIKKCTTEELLAIQVAAEGAIVASAATGKILDSKKLGLLPIILAFSPYIDNDTIMAQPIKSKFNVPVMLGYNNGEGDLFVVARRRQVNEFDYGIFMGEFFGSVYKEYLKKIKELKIPLIPKKGTAYARLLESADYTLFNCANQYVTRNQNKRQVKLYEFMYAPGFITYPVNPQLPSLSDDCRTKACHAAELPFVFNNPTNSQGDKVMFNAADKKIAQLLSTQNFSQDLLTGSDKGSDYKWFGDGVVNTISYSNGNAEIKQENVKNEKYIENENKDGYQGTTTGNPICESIYGAYSNVY